MEVVMAKATMHSQNNVEIQRLLRIIDELLKARHCPVCGAKLQQHNNQ